MILANKLRKQGYDLLLGQTRQHQLGQIWKKPVLDKISLYANSSGELFSPEFEYSPEKKEVLVAEMLSENTFGIGVGISMVKGLDKILGNIDLHLKSTRQISLGYDDAEMMEVPSSIIEKYFYKSKLNDAVPSILEAMNKNQLIFISGIIVAKGLKIHIKKDIAAGIELPQELIKVNVKIAGQTANELVLTTKTQDYIPLAVKAHRLDFDKGIFSKATLLTDLGNRFK